MGEHTFTLNSWQEPESFFFANCDTPRISSCREHTGITGNFFMKWNTTGVKNCWCPGDRVLGLLDGISPVPQHSTCSFPAPKPECKVGNPAPVPSEDSMREKKTLKTRSPALRSPRGLGWLLPGGLGVSASRYHAGAGLVSPGLVLAHTSQAEGYLGWFSYQAGCRSGAESTLEKVPSATAYTFGCQE